MIKKLFMPMQGMDEFSLFQSRFIIFTYGGTCTLKTTLTRYLAEHLPVRLLATHRYGSCTSAGSLDENKRDKRYTCMLTNAASIVARGHSVMLDGTFSNYAWRRAIYRLAATTGARIIVIKTNCNSNAYIRSRLLRRRSDHNCGDHDVTDFSNVERVCWEIEANPFEHDLELRKLQWDLIAFENGSRRCVEVSRHESKVARMLRYLIITNPFMSLEI